MHRNSTSSAIAASVSLLAILVGCEHSEPFAPAQPEPLGPYESGAIRRLTFNPGEDRAPFVIDDSVIVFTRLEVNRVDLDRCLAYLPVEGGTLLRTLCPGGAAADTMLDAWLFPAVSAAGRLGYLRHEGRITSFAPGTRKVSVGSVHAPDSVEFEVQFPFDLFGSRVNSLRRLTWDGENRLRFVAGLETFPLVNNVRDTVFAAFGLAVADVEDGTVSELDGGTGVFAYTTPHNSGFWGVSADDPQELLYVDAGSRQVAGRFSAPVVDVANVGGQPVGVLAPGTTVEWLDTGSGQPAGRIGAPGVVLNVRVAGERRLVAEVEGASDRDLWLITLP